MGLELPGELVAVLDVLGLSWPESDETALFELGQAWMQFAGTLDATVTAAQSTAQAVVAANEGAAIQAFDAWWQGDGSPVSVLQPGSPAATALGAGLMACAAIVLALKIQVIVQLVLLVVQIATAIASAGPTFGASLAWIPIARAIAKVVIEELIMMAVTELLNA
ncbi:MULTISPECIES: WXG100-like domain-containing protein [Catenuloplanes]|uniref:Outer membrane channel protein CpnT-like N-terminal domain-containing protein n=1 Tax=Catenuloplanes niger TaxID=587534 RepID=A0AAE4A104_9ACTN|nr:hypothetical protein [Catenuloplanes niger]MDR7327608.1 hypothetical protein [Catenuloplanes niger]